MGRPETFGVTHHIGRTGLAWISGCKTAASDGSEGRPRFPVSNNGLLMGVGQETGKLQGANELYEEGSMQLGRASNRRGRVPRDDDKLRARRIQIIVKPYSWALGKCRAAKRGVGTTDRQAPTFSTANLYFANPSARNKFTTPTTTSLPPNSPSPNDSIINMADRAGAPARGGFGSRGDRGGDRGRGRGRRGPRRGGAKNEEKEWQPVTKLGRLVKAGKIKSMEEIYLHSLPIKEYQIVDFFLPKLKDEVMKIKPVQKQTRAGQRTRFKAIVVIGDSEGHIGLGIKTSKEVATAIRAAIIIAKLSVVPIRRGYWGSNLGEPHSLPTKESGKCGSVTVRLIPAPRGTGLVASPAVKRLLQLAGVQDIYTASAGSTKTLENTLKATFVAVSNSYGFLTPNLWKETKLIRSPLEEYSDVLREGKRY
ncbi:40S ribosomal protein [Zalaria obscura]|uniref:40S ribosomal protein n=1 Tax=Zalaria obscura TaxID=2024903 RepID=A0ACC3S4K9_9PEZI